MAKDEIHFFDRYFSSGLGWYEQSHFSSCSGQSAIGEKTAAYLYDEKTHKRILATLGLVKLIVILRDPIPRMYSRYQRKILNGEESRPFSEAAQADPQLMFQSLYAGHLRRVLTEFPREQLHIGFYEDALQDPGRFLRGLFHFLGVDEAFAPRSTFVQTKQGLVENQHWLRKLAARIVYNPRSPYAIRVIYSKFRPKRLLADLSPEALSEMQPFFQQDIHELEAIAERNLGFWRSKS
jgi:hypothetical protein